MSFQVGDRIVVVGPQPHPRDRKKHQDKARGYQSTLGAKGTVVRIQTAADVYPDELEYKSAVPDRQGKPKFKADDVIITVQLDSDVSPARRESRARNFVAHHLQKV